MFETISTAEQAKILAQAHQMRAEALGSMFRAVFAMFRRKPASTANA